VTEKPPIPEPNALLRRAVRGFYAWVGALVCGGVSPILASQLIDHESTLARVAGVVIGTIGILPWLWMVAAIIRRGDEFTRRMHLVASSYAFGAAIVLLFGLHWTTEAGFIEPPPYLVLALAVMILWLVALFLAKRYYERER
jgi:hypothetical protein